MFSSLVVAGGIVRKSMVPYTMIYNRFNSWSQRGIWQGIFSYLTGYHKPSQQLMLDSSCVKAHRCALGGEEGENKQAIGRSRGGRTTKIHSLCDTHMRPVVFLLPEGKTSDIKVAHHNIIPTSSKNFDG